jgi:hypothetical protein
MIRSRLTSGLGYRLRDTFLDYLIVQASKVPETMALQRPEPVLSVQVHLARWLASPETARTLHELYEEITGICHSPLATPGAPLMPQQLRRTLEDAFRSGRLVALPLERAGSGLTAASAALAESSSSRQSMLLPARMQRKVPDAVTPLAPRAQTWVEIVLVGEDDQLVPNERFRLVLPDGTAREGRLDARGCARVDEIPQGQCQVFFPELDAQAWERI